MSLKQRLMTAIDHYLALGHQTDDLYVGVKTEEGMAFLPIIS